MKNALIGIGAFAAFISTPVLAAELEYKAPATPPYETLSNWAGPYIGGFIGGTMDASPGVPDNFIGGGFVGTNFQSGNTIWGLEGDAARIGNWGWDSTLRARFGVLLTPSTLLYGATCGLQGSAAAFQALPMFSLGASALRIVSIASLH